MERPAEGMRVPAFIKMLSNGEYKDERHRYKGFWLRDEIEDEFSSQTRVTERYIGKTNHETLWPASYLKKQPGTIVK